MSADDSIYLSTQAGYDLWSEFYDQDDIPLALLEEEALAKELGPVNGLKVLELGCGTGRQTLELAKAGAIMTAVDQSEGMLKQARAKEGHGIDFRNHDLEKAFPFAEGSFDRVVSFLVVEHLGNPEAFFSECCRTCHEEGFVYVTTMHPAMLLKGVQARYTDPKTGTKVYPKGYPHRTSDYVNASIRAGLELIQMGEYQCDESHTKRSERALKYLNYPLLLTLKFKRR